MKRWPCQVSTTSSKLKKMKIPAYNHKNLPTVLWADYGNKHQLNIQFDSYYHAKGNFISDIFSLDIAVMSSYS